MNLMAGGPSVTELLHRAERGDADAADRLFTTMYAELRRLARARLRAGGRDALLDTSSLVHESYLRFAGAGRLRLQDRTHFVRWAGRAMRSVIVDFARRRLADRRGGGQATVRLTTGIGEVASGESEILRVHTALEDMAARDPRMADIVEMRYFAGMTQSEIAEAIGVHERTVRREWEKARLFLREALEPPSPRGRGR
jgi:RNA polymerase sigma factor (TIGR02999 family)